MAIVVKETPEGAGFPAVNSEEEADKTPALRDVFKAITSSPVVWIIACAYACTGAVRQSIDQWFPRFLQDVHQIDYSSSQFQFLAFMIPFAATVGSLISGYVSDILFNGQRASVAAGLYFLEVLIVLLAARAASMNAAIIFLVLIALTANATHSLLGTAAPMDLGGAKMAGFATGLIDSFQYFGGSLAGYFLGSLLDKNWGGYFYFMAPFGLVGGLLMLSIIGRISLIRSNI